MLATTDYYLTRQWFAELEASGRARLAHLFQKMKEGIDTPTYRKYRIADRAIVDVRMPPQDQEKEDEKPDRMSGRLELELLTGRALERRTLDAGSSHTVSNEEQDELRAIAATAPLLRDIPIEEWTEKLRGRDAAALSTSHPRRPSYALLLSLYEKAKLEKAELAARVDQLDAIHRELHHRTKNNFKQFERFIRAALGKENRKNGSALRDILARVDSMAALHGQLYRGSDISELDFKHYLLLMHQRMEELYDLDVEVIIDCTYRPDPIQALQLGLIVNEMMTNAFKYAFPRTDDPTCRISCHRHKGVMEFSLADNGGPQDNTSARNVGFGSRLIAQLTEQLTGIHRCVNDRFGTTHYLKI